MDLPNDRWRIADHLFDAALDMRPDQRKVYLDQECQDDFELRELVERLLGDAETSIAHITPGGGLESPLWEGLATEFNPKCETPAGTKVGRYEIVREVGRGGMAEVFLAEAHDRTPPRWVALKIIRMGFDTEELLQRFDRERQILDRAHHPNIARLYEAGVCSDGRPFLAMEFVKGQSIELYADTATLSINNRLRLFLQVSQAVEYAHRNHVIHRDIKPSNILVTANRRVKLLDFGIARLLDGAEMSLGAVPLTLSHSRLMTPAYASPELIQSARVSVSSDIYQLGLLFYLLLTGRWPYPVFKRHPGDVVNMVCHQEARPPSETVTDPDAPRPPEGGAETLDELAAHRHSDTAQLHLALTGPLDEIALKILMKNPADRYTSVGQIIADIEGYLP
jgi:serine/threonine-protein kinase